MQKLLIGLKLYIYQVHYFFSKTIAYFNNKLAIVMLTDHFPDQID